MAERVRQAPHGVALIAGRYELVSELGAAHEEEVLEWEGFDRALERAVVVRFLRPDLVDDPVAVERFWDAARASARASTLTGERVLDGGTDAETGRVFLIREWSAGPSTREADHAVALRARRASGAGSSRASPRRLAMLGGALVLVGALSVWALQSGVERWLAWVNAPLGQVSGAFVLPPVIQAPAVGKVDQAATATAAPLPTPAAGVTPARATVAATPRATPTPGLGAGVTRRIVNTDGRGVALRAAPGGDRLPAKGYDEGATVTAFESVGEWTHIRGSDGREGWVLTVTLAP